MAHAPFSMPNLARLPAPYDPARAARTLDDLKESASSLLADVDIYRLLEFASGNSAFLSRIMLREGAFLARLFEEGPDAVLKALEEEALAQGAQSDLTEVARNLRIAKRRVALSIALADIAGLYDLEKVTSALTRFADASVRGALRASLCAAARKAGMEERTPEDWETQTGLVVLAMGKMGAFELNYSSDIDVVVFYEESRFPFALQGDKRGAAVAIVRDLVKLVAENTVDSYVFRIDLRLRPDASATQIAISTEAAEFYYESMGQNWERAAMIKARACAGDPEAAAQFLSNMRPFIWRKNLDYAAIADIHSIKRQIHAHGGHSRVAILGHNIKLGRGGIREIEFFAQTQQLILGGRDPGLRSPRTREALAALRERGLISSEAEADMMAAYRFLRQVEHRLQMIDDRQTHDMPDTRDGLHHVARFMGYSDTDAFEKDLLLHLTNVERNYAHLFESEAPLAATEGSLVFTGVEDDPETIATLTHMGFTRPSDIAGAIRGWHHGRVRAMRSPRARELLTTLMPALLEALSKTAGPDMAFANFDRFLGNLPSGVQLFSLLLANPQLLKLVAEIAGSAPRVADYLGRNPAVLDALMDRDFLTAIPDAAKLQDSLERNLAAMPGMEGALDAARRFAKEETFRIGVHVIEQLTDAGDVGPAYAAVAETVIAGLQPIIEKEMSDAHGRVKDGAFAIVAQGKLGGREMTAGSDLDLVFIYTHDEAVETSDGKKPLAPGPYFARAAQRFIAALTALTAEGRLYEVDMRLRPSGNQGPVAVKLETFAEYHREKSWTWERLALTRARVLSGPEPLRASVDAVIRAALTKKVERATIIEDAREMRGKLAAQFPGKDAWDIKFASGGLVDIEFIAQSLQLVHGHEADVLDQNTIAALKKLARAGFLSAEDEAGLVEAARMQTALTQVLRIALEGPFKAETATPGLKALLARAGGANDFESVDAALRTSQARVRDIFIRLIGKVG